MNALKSLIQLKKSVGHILAISAEGGVLHSLVFLSTTMYRGIITIISAKLLPTRYLVRLMNVSPWARRLIVSSTLHTTNLFRDRRYLSTVECARKFQLNQSKEGLTNILVSPESDYRYAWLELAAHKYSQNTQVIYLPRFLFGDTSIHYMGEYEGQLEGFDTDMEGFDARLGEYHTFLRKLVRTIEHETSPDAFVSASPNDLRWRETIKVSRQFGIPWVITEREGVTSPGKFKRNISFEREHFDFEADLLLTSNPLHTEYWETLGLRDGEIKQVGDLKSDFWNNESLSFDRSDFSDAISESKFLILYFAFGKRNYIEERMFPDEDRDWTYLQKQHWDVLTSVASNYDEHIQLALKAGRTLDLEGYASLESDASRMENVILLDRFEQALDLISNADAIVGFQTTALIESMFTQTPIIYPAWGELFYDVLPELLPFHESGAVTWARSPREFEDALTSLADSPMRAVVDERTMNNRRTFRREYYQEPGDVGLRTLREIEELAAE